MKTERGEPHGKLDSIFRAIFVEVDRRIAIKRKIAGEKGRLLVQRRKRERNFDYLYSSVVHRAEFGKRMVGTSGKDRKGEKHCYYGHKGLKGACKPHATDALDLHKALRNRFRKLAEEPAFVEALYQGADTNQVALIPDNERRIALLEVELKALEQRVARLMATLGSDPSEIVRTLVTKELETQGALFKTKTDEKNALQARSLGARGAPVERQEFSALAKSWDKKFSKLTQAERKTIHSDFPGPDRDFAQPVSG